MLKKFKNSTWAAWQREKCDYGAQGKKEKEEEKGGAR